MKDIFVGIVAVALGWGPGSLLAESHSSLAPISQDQNAFLAQTGVQEPAEGDTTQPLPKQTPQVEEPIQTFDVLDEGEDLPEDD